MLPKYLIGHVGSRVLPCRLQTEQLGPVAIQKIKTPTKSYNFVVAFLAVFAGRQILISLLRFRSYPSFEGPNGGGVNSDNAANLRPKYREIETKQ